MQREVIAMKARGTDLRLYSLWGGGGEFHGVPVKAFNKWRLLELAWLIPWLALTRWDVFGILLRGLVTRRAPSALNFWENMLGAGFAGVFHRHFLKSPPDHGGSEQGTRRVMDQHRPVVWTAERAQTAPDRVGA